MLPRARETDEARRGYFIGRGRIELEGTASWMKSHDDRVRDVYL